MTLITLQVGERRYFSEEKTLVEGSTYFKARLTGTLKGTKEADGSYFIDRDGLLFEHILSFLRTGICPLFHDDTNGFDHAKYIRLGAEAEYFAVKKLHGWISAGKYGQVIQFNRYAYLKENLADMYNGLTGDDKFEHIPMWRIRKVYKCPRGIDVHRGKPDSCGRLCGSFMAASGAEYDDERELVVVVIHIRKLVFGQLLKP